MNSTFDVYKVIDNNGGVASTVEPSAINQLVYSVLVIVIDGNICIHFLQVNKQTFLSTDFMHVSTESSDYSTTGGAIEHVKITGGWFWWNKRNIFKC